MPWTLYKYILRELLKLLGLTTVVLVVVMSFAAAVQADERRAADAGTCS